MPPDTWSHADSHTDTGRETVTAGGPGRSPRRRCRLLTEIGLRRFFFYLFIYLLIYLSICLFIYHQFMCLPIKQARGPCREGPPCEEGPWGRVPMGGAQPCTAGPLMPAAQGEGAWAARLGCALVNSTELVSRVCLVAGGRQEAVVNTLFQNR